MPIKIIMFLALILFVIAIYAISHHILYLAKLMVEILAVIGVSTYVISVIQDRKKKPK